MVILEVNLKVNRKNWHHDVVAWHSEWCCTILLLTYLLVVKSCSKHLFVVRQNSLHCVNHNVKPDNVPTWNLSTAFTFFRQHLSFFADAVIILCRQKPLQSFSFLQCTCVCQQRRPTKIGRGQSDHLRSTDTKSRLHLWRIKYLYIVLTTNFDFLEV